MNDVKLVSDKQKNIKEKKDKIETLEKKYYPNYIYNNNSYYNYQMNQKIREKKKMIKLKIICLMIFKN